jgi:Domain of unknown function (DUF5348)
MPMTGTLLKNESGRWEIHSEGQSVELTSGSAIEVQIGGHWIKTGIEYAHDTSTRGGGDYYATTRGVKLTKGLPARVS